MRSALWLIKSIQQRQRTIYKVSKSIVKFQRDFLDRGIEYLRPLVLRDIAEDIGMHESTISRVTTNKYMQTPQGLFELKYFFNSGISTSEGDFIASESVKSKIKEIVEAEDPKRPYQRPAPGGDAFRPDHHHRPADGHQVPRDAAHRLVIGEETAFLERQYAPLQMQRGHISCIQ